jgi:iron complex outermembrane receptor protein
LKDVNYIRRGLLATAASIAVVFGDVAVAFAQTAAAPDDNQAAAESDNTARLDTVLVTARRREESLYDVPGSVSAFSEEQVRDLQATDMRRVQYSVPNFHFERSDSSNAAVYVRGIGQNDSLPFVEPGVGVYIDGVYQARTQTAFLDLFDVDRVEVLRGPQGTLYGRNSPGGAVKLITSQPGDEFEAYLEAGLGNFDLRAVNARISGPLTESGALKGKLAISSLQRDGFSRNATEGGRDGDTNTLAWRSALVFEPTADLRFELATDGKIEDPDRSLTPIRRTSLTLFPDPVGDSFNPVTLLPTEQAFNDEYIVEGNANNIAKLETGAITFKAQWEFADNWRLESVSSYRATTWEFLLDSDNSPYPVLDVFVDEEDEQFSSELLVAYENDAGFSFTGGLFYFHDYDIVLSSFDDASAAFSVGGFTGPIINVGVPSSGYGESRQETESVAAFAAGTFPLSDATSLELGVRYTQDEKDVTRRGEFFFDPTMTIAFDRPPFLGGVGFPSATLQGNETWDAVTPRAVLTHEVNGDTTVYASASRGFKSGGFPGRAFGVSEFIQFEPETVWTYEAGVKAQRFNNRLNMTAAYFYTDYKDLQLNGFGQDPATGNFVSLFTNAASAKIQGFELGLNALPRKGLSIDATLGYLDAEYDEFETLVAGVLTDVSDRRLTNSPKWTGFIGATHEFDWSNGWVTRVHGDVAYRDTHANESTDSPFLSVGSATYLNAFVSVGSGDGSWEVRAGGTNLTDVARAAQSFNTSEFSGVETAFMAPPRQYDVRLILRF